MPKYLIRRAKKEDAPEFIAFTKVVGGESDNLLFGSEGIQVPTKQVEMMLENSLFLLAVKQEEVIASAQVAKMRMPRVSHRGSIAISVKKAYWGKGLASKIYQAAIDLAKAKGLEYLELIVRADNLPAIKLYQKFDFTQAGRLIDFYKIEDQYFDGLIMCKDIRPATSEQA